MLSFRSNVDKTALTIVAKTLKTEIWRSSGQQKDY